MRWAKKQEIMTHEQEKKDQSIKNVPEEVQILDLLNTDFKASVKTMVKESNQSMCKKIKGKYTKSISPLEDIIKYIESIKITRQNFWS